MSYKRLRNTAQLGQQSSKDCWCLEEFVDQNTHLGNASTLLGSFLKDSLLDNTESTVSGLCKKGQRGLTPELWSRTQTKQSYRASQRQGYYDHLYYCFYLVLKVWSLKSNEEGSQLSKLSSWVITKQCHTTVPMVLPFLKPLPLWKLPLELTASLTHL